MVKPRFSVEDMRKALFRLGIDTEIEYYDIEQEESEYYLLFLDNSFSIQSKYIEDCSIEDECVRLKVWKCRMLFTRGKIEISL